jgi:hypothetical protein
VKPLHPASKREEYTKLKQRIRQLDELRSEMVTLQRSIDILKKGDPSRFDAKIRREMTPSISFQEFFDNVSSTDRSIAEYAQDVLREAGKPLTINEILPAVLAKGKTVTRPTLAGEIYRNVKLGRVFKKVGPGLFGLLESKEVAQR